MFSKSLPVIIQLSCRALARHLLELDWMLRKKVIIKRTAKGSMGKM